MSENQEWVREDEAVTVGEWLKIYNAKMVNRHGPVTTEALSIYADMIEEDKKCPCPVCVTQRNGDESLC